MSRSNKTLNFYIYQMEEGFYNLYNALTDKEIYWNVDSDIVKSFLSLNEPTHPFVATSEEDLISFSFDPIDASGMAAYLSDWDSPLCQNENDYSVHNPYIAGQESHYQMNFSFINEKELNSERDRDEEEGLDEDYEYLPESK